MSRAAEALSLGSGLAIAAAAALVLFRAWSAPVPVAPPAVYTPVAVKPPKSGAVKETERPANGFILVVEATPDGTALAIDGKESGEAPASFNFDCKPGTAYQLRLSHAGYADVLHTVECKKDVMLLVTAALKKP